MMARATSLNCSAIAPGVAPQQGECLVHVHLSPLGHDALGLFDDDPGVECALELAGQVGPVLDGPLLEDPDGRRVGQGLGEVHLLGESSRSSGLKMFMAPITSLRSRKRHRVHHLETGLSGLRGEPRPAVHGIVESLVEDLLAVYQAIPAGTLVILELDQLEGAHAL